MSDQKQVTFLIEASRTQTKEFFFDVVNLTIFDKECENNNYHDGVFTLD